MCRVNPKKIRQPKSFPECWILNPTPDEIRPYRILIKKVSSSSSNDGITTTPKPIDFIISAIKSNDHSFYNKSSDPNFLCCSSINNQKISNDYFVIRLYTSIYYKFLNEYLRTHKILNKFHGYTGFTESELNSWICCLHLALKRNKNVKENQIVYRAVEKKLPPEIRIGSKFYFKEFVSTSIKKDFSLEWLKGKGNKGTIFIIKIKNNGTNGHQNYCFYIENITYTKKQYEVLISSHCYFILTKRDYGKDIEYVHLLCEGYLLD